jgi:hypothetical protein
MQEAEVYGNDSDEDKAWSGRVPSHHGTTTPLRLSNW